MGGVGDVVRDLPIALASQGWQVTVITPSYGVFHRLPGARQIGSFDVTFRSVRHTVDCYEVSHADSTVRCIVFEHELFSPHGPGKIYCSDDPGRPFATDASKFAFFAVASATWMCSQERLPDVVHLHDWHAATFAVLRGYDDSFSRLRSVRTVYTIHNLSYQGIRPISGDESSLEEWFPELRYAHSRIRDPHHAECFNPMAAAIRLADRTSTVSPSYAEEICRATNNSLGFVGGEGLEHELTLARDAGKLVGILNGCEYGAPAGRRPGWQRVLNMIAGQIETWLDAYPASRMHAIARKRIATLPKRRPKTVMTSVGRLVRQKASLMFEPLEDGIGALEHVLEGAGNESVVIVLGSGEAEYENRMADLAERARNLLFLCGFSETLADPLYRAGDLFLMPSSFEPCGISQMLAMRAAQPCVVHGVGGLRDTVENDRTGFVFDGATPREQATRFVRTVDRALTLRRSDDDSWQSICIRAASKRFSWASAAQKTIEELYVAA